MDEILFVPTLLAVFVAAAGILVDRKHTTARNILVILAVVFLGAYSMYIAPFIRGFISDNFLNDFGLIPICWIFGFMASIIIGAAVAIFPSIILVRRDLGFVKTALIVNSFTFILGLFLFEFEGCF